MSDFPQIQLYILSHNRPQLLLETLESCLKIDYPNFEIIISDNSTTADVFNALQKHPQLNARFKIIRRNHLSHFSKHVDLILQEVTAPFFMIFHDDDLLAPHILKHYIKIMLDNPTVAACAGNAFLIKDNNKTNQKFIAIERDTLISDIREFQSKYFLEAASHPPFPFYFYRTEMVKKTRISNLEGGIHCDTTFLYKVMKLGSLYCIQEVCGYYILHDSNMSKKINIRSVNSLFHFFKSREPQHTQALVHYKYRNYLRFFFQNRWNIKLFGQRNYRIIFCRSAVYLLQNLPYYLKKVTRKLLF